MKIFVINPGSTSTKIALFIDEKPVWAAGAEIGDWQRRVSKPSKDVFIMGYSEWSALNNTNAFFSVYRFTLLNSSMGPVSHKPSGIMTLPPPLALTCWIASLIAFVFKVIPSGLAPKSMMFTE